MIEIKSVDIGKKIRILVRERQGSSEGKTILITGGMDGDEYAGIEAAYKLINYYSTHSFSGKIIIIPLVNIPGFIQGVSYNPLDNKYPKYIYPGKKSGSSTERLLYWLSTNYINQADIWIDLHGGAMTEELNPFTRTWQTKNQDVNHRIKTILKEIKSDVKIYDQEKDKKIEELARQGTSYILLESGGLGSRKIRDVERHVNWVKTIVRVTGGKIKTSQKAETFFSKVHYYIATQDGLWHPISLKKKIKKETTFGNLVSFSGKQITTLKSSQAGTLLWLRKSMNAVKGEVMAAIASF